MTAAGEATGTDTYDCTACAQLRLEAADDVDYDVAPAAGGGWPEWAAALTRLLRRIGREPARALIISQALVTDRYVQMQIGHGQAWVEASSNVYLTGGSRLSTEQEALLTQIGWRRPERDVDMPDEYPSNWTFPLVQGTWDEMVEVILATIAGVFGFCEDVPVNIHTFQLDEACKDCFFPVAEEAA